MSAHHPLKVKPLQKVMEEAESRSGGLRPSLGVIELLAIGIGATVGAGIFVLSGVAAREAGPAVVLSFALAGLGCAFAAFAYADLGAALPVTGSAYAYVYASLGELAAWIVGWNLLLEYALGASMVASGWSGYLNGVLTDVGLHLPHWAVKGGFDVPAVLIVIVLASVVLCGMRESARLTKIMVVLKLLAVFAVIGLGAMYVKVEHWTPFVPQGWGSVATAAALVFMAYVGFDVVSATAAEVREPGRDLPRGIVGSLVVCTLLYAAMSGVLTGMVTYNKISETSPITSAFNAVGMRFIGGVIAAGALIGMASVLLAMLIGLPRILLAMGRDGLLPAWTAQVDQRSGTPVATTVLAAGVIALASATLPIDALASLAGVGTLTAFTAVCASVPVLRNRERELARPFRFPGPAWAPWLGVVICLGLLSQIRGSAWIGVLAWVALGQVVYFAYGFRNSNLRLETVAEVSTDGR